MSVAVPAIPPNPNTPATIAITRNTKAQYNIFTSPWHRLPPNSFSESNNRRQRLLDFVRTRSRKKNAAAAIKRKTESPMKFHYGPLLADFILIADHPRSFTNCSGVATMNKDVMKGKLKQLGGEIKRKWGQITDNDVTQAEGEMEKLVGTIQQRTGERREEIEKWFKHQGC